MALEAPIIALVALTAFDAGIYARSFRGTEGELERIVEPVVLLATLAAISVGLMIGGTGAAVTLTATVWSRALFDALHLGDGNILAIDLPRDYALYAMVVKAAAGALYVVFAFPWG